MVKNVCKCWAKKPWSIFCCIDIGNMETIPTDFLANAEHNCGGWASGAPLNRQQSQPGPGRTNDGLMILVSAREIGSKGTLRPR